MSCWFRETQCNVSITIAVSILGAEAMVSIAPEVAWISKLFLLQW